MPAQVIPERNALDHAIEGTSATTTNSPPISPKRLEGKVAIVTGGAKGIGEATVRLFARHGARVVIADIDDAAGNALAESLSPSSPSAAIYVHCDVSSEPDVEALISSAVARFGRLDVLFNNAGVLGSQSGAAKSIANLDADEFDLVMRVNVRGAALGMKHAARAMQRGGCVISTASVAGVMGGLGPHAYAASKHAVVGLTRNAACELGRRGIRVNCISPFGVATSMLINAWSSGGGDHGHGHGHDGGHVDSGGPSDDDDECVEKMEEMVRGLANLKGVTLKARDVAEAALYLASDESKYVSGHNLVVDGGFTSSKNCVGL